MVQKAHEIHVEQSARLADYTAARTGHETAIRVVPPLAKTLQRAVHAIARWAARSAG
ncbi:hypothetical protein [Nocardioides sp. GY 10127]|uniref:hypothetical protein n=1 Tax=Nocardioides sp. GY 10127 TaxID=2569762 RepID=UPI001458AE8F|nr:hypothetical protein [Nocardioides sp. GY 10127]